ncbi:hypothetical protein X801_10160 [Opisthorchis viverrini]|uniref:ENT domain-containing protein n=1 Tax=Opisthorchis viverrini TaxID=6198 RepID=A0A1S8WIE1_OPIVI|nr:hypothetical protein X801_10160 [Opisthorchis viverrini]
MSRVEQAAKDYGPIWPMLLDYSRRECYQILRRLELEAYGRIVAVFRAQGALTNEKRKVLHKLQGFFGISTERHKAEVRRVVNDEELATISETLCGKEASDDWISEGKRIVPILHRPSPETAYLDVANKASQEHSTLNSGLPHPSDTALSESQLGRIRRNYRLFDLSQTKAPSSKTVTYDKATETTRSLQGSPAHVQMDVDETISGLVPRVEYEVTCETDSIGPVYLQAGILNGHIQSAMPAHGQSVSLRTQRESSRGDNANHQLTGAVLHRSPQEVTSYCTVDKDINSYKPVDLVSTSPAKPGAPPLTVINAHSPRKRCFSATVPYETTTTWSAVNVVYTPSTAATPTNRRTSYSHLTGTVTSPPDNQRIPSSTGGTGTLRVAQPTMGSGQLIQTPSLGKTVPQASAIVTPPGTPQVTRPQTSLVMQEATAAYQRIPCSSVGTLFVSTRPTPSTLARKYPSALYPQTNSFKSPNVGSRLHATPPRPSTAVRSTSDPPESVTRQLSVAPSPTISSVQSLHGVSTPNRIQGVNTVFIPSPDSSRVVSTSPFPKHSTSLVTVPTNQLLTGPPKSDQLSDVPTSQMTKRLVYPPNTSMFVPSTSSTSVSGSSHNITSNNVVVFQRTANRNIALPAAAALKVGTSVSSTQPPGSNIVSSGGVPSSTGSRQLRILGVSTVSPSHPLSFTAPATTESSSTPETPVDSERKAELSVTSQSEDFIPSLLARASRLGAMLDVDLDADEVPPEPQSDADVPQCAATTGDFPQTDGMDSESCWTQLNRDAYYAESNSPSSVNASCNTPETSNSVELLPESTAGLKGGQLWAILGLSSHPTTLRHPEEPTEFAAAESEKPTAHEKWDQAQLPDYSSDDLSSEAPEPKRLRLSSGLNPAVHSDCKGLLDNPDPTSRWQTLKDLLTYLKQVASSFVHCAASDEPEPHTLKKSFAPDCHLLDALRTVRQLGASLCTLGEERGETTEALTLTLTTVTNFLDALLLVLFKGKQVSVHWLSVDASIQSSAALALSISLQCLSNTLAAFQTLDIEYPSTTLMSLTAVVLSGSRTRLLLTQTILHSFQSVTEEQRHRIISYSSYLLYSLLRAFHQVGLSDSVKNLVCTKLIHEPLVFSSLCHLSSHVLVIQEGFLRNTRLHVQLLLHQVADTLDNYPCREPDQRSSSVSLDDVLQSTGIVLWLRQRAAQAEFQQSQTNSGRVVSLPHTLPACLLFWHAFLQESDQTAATMGVILDYLSQKLKLSYDSWFQALTTAVITADDPQDHEFPYAQLRGLVHVLAEAIFSKTRYADPLSGSSTPISCFSQESDAFQSLMAGQGVQLWDCLCDLLVMLIVTSKHLEVHFAASSSWIEQHPVRTVGGSKCTVYPSRIAEVLPTIHPTSAFSLCQAIGFQQDCIRCLTGLLHHNPKLSISLASHRVDKFPLCLPENACTAAFEALLDATNKQPGNPFAPEWAVLAIRLALKPNTKDPTALEGARLLAKRLGDLKLIRQSRQRAMNVVPRCFGLRSLKFTKMLLATAYLGRTASNRLSSDMAQSTAYDQSKESAVGNELLQRYFHNSVLQCKLRELVEIAAAEAQLGRWPSASHPSSTEVEPLQQHLTEPLQRHLNLTLPGVLKILRFVCSISRETLEHYTENTRSTSHGQFLLELLNPHRLLVNLYDPLSHVGIRQPSRLLYACPGLLLGCSIPVQTSCDTLETSHTSESRKRTVVTDALDELSSLLPRNDCISLLNRFPGVLLRPREELNELHTYLVEKMGLLSTEIVRASRTRTQSHALRHATGLRLVNCPAWCLPIERVRTRHSLALLTGCWPLSKAGTSYEVFLSSMDVNIFESILSKTAFGPEPSGKGWRIHELADYAPPDEEPTQTTDAQT